MAGAHAVYTDVWASMGEEATLAERVALLKPYKITPELMALTGRRGSIFLHCLPAFHNLETEVGKRHPDICEVEDEVFEGPQSRVFDEAENRVAHHQGGDGRDSRALTSKFRQVNIFDQCDLRKREAEGENGRDRMKKVVVFGAGLVVRAHVRYLLDHEVRGDRGQPHGEQGRGHHRRAPQRQRRWPSTSRSRADELEAIIAEHDLAVSLLPWQYHPDVARACLNTGKHMVTTSYVKDEMQALDAEAKEKGLMLLNEIGVDPGIDHMTAMKVIHRRCRPKAARSPRFQSYCGGLPAPEANDNPYGYKFSWSPRGVLLAGHNPARFRRDGVVETFPGEELFDQRLAGAGRARGQADRVRGLPQPRQHALHRVLRHRPQRRHVPRHPAQPRLVRVDEAGGTARLPRHRAPSRASTARPSPSSRRS